MLLQFLLIVKKFIIFFNLIIILLFIILVLLAMTGRRIDKILDVLKQIKEKIK
ncbi:hypothetical protein ES703_84313 [subsurface metagenome]